MNNDDYQSLRSALKARILKMLPEEMSLASEDIDLENDVIDAKSAVFYSDLSRMVTISKTGHPNSFDAIADLTARRMMRDAEFVLIKLKTDCGYGGVATYEETYNPAKHSGVEKYPELYAEILDKISERFSLYLFRKSESAALGKSKIELVRPLRSDNAPANVDEACKASNALEQQRGFIQRHFSRKGEVEKQKGMFTNNISLCLGAASDKTFEDMKQAQSRALESDDYEP